MLLSNCFTDEVGAEVKQFLVDGEWVSKVAIAGLTKADMPGHWQNGRKAALFFWADKFHVELAGLPGAKRARVADDAGEQPGVDLLGPGGGVPKQGAKQKYVVFLDGQQVPTNSTDTNGERQAAAQLVMRTASPAQFRVLGMAPSYDSPVDGNKLKQVGTEVYASLMAGVDKGNTTAEKQLWWDVGVVMSTMRGARVWTDAAVLTRLLRGRWDKYELWGLSLRDFHREGPFKVGAAVMVDYSFILLLQDALRGLMAVVAAVLSATLYGFADASIKRLSDFHLGLVSTTQVRLFTAYNDAVSNALEEARCSMLTPTGRPVATAVEVKELLEYHLSKVTFSDRNAGAADNDHYDEHRRSMYEWTEHKAPAASATSKGGVAEGKGPEVKAKTDEGKGGKDAKGEGFGTLCVEWLREALELRSRVHFNKSNGLGRQKRNAAPAKGEFIKCTVTDCSREHVQLNRQTKAGLLARLATERVDVTKGMGLDIKEALDVCTRLKK